MSTSSLRIYRSIAFAWAALFVVTGAEFAAIPGLLGTGLHALARLLQLHGTIDVSPGTLWHVLALSLMVAVTGLALLTARRPADRGPYLVLMAAKLASTCVFLYLAATLGSIWLLCAATDGFVALTLFLARRGLDPPAKVPGFERAQRPAPFYEVWFVKVDLGPDRALWLRYTLLDGKTREAGTWALLFDHERIRAGKTTWPLEVAGATGTSLLPDCGDVPRFLGQQAVFHVADGHLDSGNALGSAGEIAWDLRWQDSGCRFEHTPAVLRALGLAGSVFRSPLLDLRVSGSVRIGSEIIEIDGATGMLGHIFGKRQAHGWAWAHCNRFDGGENAVFEGLSARVRVAGMVTPPLSSFVLDVGGARFAFSGLWQLTAAQTTWGGGTWRFSARCGSARLVGELTAPPTERVALVTYTDTDDSNLWCANSKLANLKLELSDPRRGVHKVLTATGTAAFEEVGRDRPQRAVVL